jgi:hypothetical protein
VVRSTLEAVVPPHGAAMFVVGFILRS